MEGDRWVGFAFKDQNLVGGKMGNIFGNLEGTQASYA